MQNATRQSNVLQYQTAVKVIGRRVPQEIFDMIIVMAFEIGKSRGLYADRYETHPDRLIKAAVTKSASFRLKKPK